MDNGQITWREREVMIRDAHRRWRARQHKIAQAVARMTMLRGGAALDPVDEMLTDYPLAFEVSP